MILFQCSCGAGCRAEDEQIGSIFCCPSCGRKWTVPEQSREDMVVIFTAGSPVEGNAVLISDLTEGVSNGRYHPIDLLWHEGSWKPLDLFYDFPTPPPPAPPAEENEIALKCSFFPPMEKYSPNGNGNDEAGNSPLAKFCKGVSHFFHTWTGKTILLLLLLFAAAAVAWYFLDESTIYGLLKRGK